jgi:hypothetical protein
MNEQTRPERVGLGAAIGAVLVLGWAVPVAAEPGDAAIPPAPAAVEPEPNAETTEPAPAAAEPEPEPGDAASAPVPTAAEPEIRTPRIAPFPAGAQTALRTSAAAPSTSVPRIGTMLDVGVPDGATISIVVRPIRAIRAQAGLSHNMISLGQRIGVSVAPLAWWASPTLTLEYGRFADGNANPLVRAVSGDTSFQSAVLERVGYSYANARLGVELGRKWFTFYIHAGVSRIAGTVHNLSTELMSEQAGTTTLSFTKDPNARLWVPSADLGFVVYLAK